MISTNYNWNLFFVFLTVYSVYSLENEKNTTVAEHNRLIMNQDQISDNTVTISTPSSKCMKKKNCSSCIENDINLQCYWCDHRCYSIMDSQKGCKSMNINPEDVCASDFPVVSSTTFVNSSGKTFVKSGPHYYTHLRTIFFMLSLSSMIMILAWTFYACFSQIQHQDKF